MAIDITTKTWRNLTQLKNHIEANVRGEKVVSFDGMFLVTNKSTYGLLDGKVVIDDEIHDNRQKVIQKTTVRSEAVKNRMKLLDEKISGKTVAKKTTRKKS